MSALTQERDTACRGGDSFAYRVGGGKRIFAGALVVLRAGYAEPGSAALGLKAVGRAAETVDNTGGPAGAAVVLVERGIYLYFQDGTITQADVGTPAYIVDDQTLAKGDGDGTRSVAGIIRAVEPNGVWVEII